eukprot:scaffold32540_cov73-Isochrysis_galbana.AAC.1
MQRVEECWQPGARLESKGRREGGGARRRREGELENKKPRESRKTKRQPLERRKIKGRAGSRRPVGLGVPRTSCSALSCLSSTVFLSSSFFSRLKSSDRALAAYSLLSLRAASAASTSEATAGACATMAGSCRGIKAGRQRRAAARGTTAQASGRGGRGGQRAAAAGARAAAMPHRDAPPQRVCDLVDDALARLGRDRAAGARAQVWDRHRLCLRPGRNLDALGRRHSAVVGRRRN